MPYLIGFGTLALIVGFVVLSIRNAIVFRAKAEAYADKCVNDWQQDGKRWSENVDWRQ